MKVRKAVILAAGLGTRMLPATKVVPKELLPVVDTPAVQLVAEEAARSGIEEIIFVISPGKTSLIEHFAPAPELERALEEREKAELLDLVQSITRLARITAVEQHQPLGLGHAVLQAKNAVGSEPFAVMLPDDIFDCHPPLLRQLLDIAESKSAPVIALQKVARSEVRKYGIVEGSATGRHIYQITGMVEKPPPERAPSQLAIVGRYILVPEIFDLLKRAKPGVGGEIQLTDALLTLAQRRALYGYQITGARYDLGDRAGFVLAQVAYALKRSDLAASLQPRLRALLAPE
jgi:UTP--glucose-1-phosphate uridylyltransferase